MEWLSGMLQAQYYGADIFPGALEVWRHDGIGCAQVKGSGTENAKLKKIVAEQMLAIEGLKEIATKKNGNLDRREALGILTGKGLSQRSTCRIAGVSRRIVSYEVKQPVKDGAVAARLIEASSRYVWVSAHCCRD
jgi:hypothetical protein